MTAISRAAETDISAACQWYLDADPNVAGRFRDRLRQMFLLIQERPALFSRVSSRVGRARLGWYPHDVFFIVGGDGLPRIIAVLLERRDPVVWQARR